MFVPSREAVRIKVKKYEGSLPAELQKFSVDPQITSLEVLQSILAKAFNLKKDFTLSYKSVTDSGHEEHLSLLSDWDLDAAFLRAQNVSSGQGGEPCVQLRVDVRDWEGPAGARRRPQQPQPARAQDAPEVRQAAASGGFQGILMNQMEKTLSLVTRALNFSDDPSAVPRPPLSDAEFRSFLDPVGQLVQAAELRRVVYCGGIDPSLRRVVWKHILNVYPDGMSGKERMDYMKKKSAEYLALKDHWRDCLHRGQVTADLAYVTGMVKKDVLRTDRHHKFYAGNDDNQNVASLFNILTTYALNHPVVSYCQGMSDLASPLLVTMHDEAHAYICLCALMERLQPNFLLDGEAMTLKFAHLTESLQVYDRQFYAYLKCQQADDLLFCYRWLLLEMKREFAFEDSLRMLEVLWSSLPPRPPVAELALKAADVEGQVAAAPTPASPAVKAPRESAYTKLCAIRRQNSSASLSSALPARGSSYRRMNHSLDGDIGKRNVDSTALQFSKEFQSLDESTLTDGLADHRLGFGAGETDSTLRGSRARGTSEGEADAPALTAPGRRPPVKRPPDLQRLAFDNSFRSSDKSDVRNDRSEEKERPPRLIKSLDEFKNFSSTKRPNADSVETERSSSEEGERAKDDTNTVDDLRDPTSEDGIRSSVLRESDDEDSSPDDSKEYSPMTTSVTRELALELASLDRQMLGETRGSADVRPQTDSRDDGDDIDLEFANETSLSESEKSEGRAVSKSAPFDDNKKRNMEIASDDVFVWENPLHGKSPGEKENRSSDIIRPIATGTPTKGTSSACRRSETENGKSDPLSRVDGEPRSKGDSREAMKQNSKFFSNMSQELENARKNCEILLANKRSANLQSIASTITNFQKKYDIQSQLSPGDRNGSPPQACEEVSEGGAGAGAGAGRLPRLLPPPHAFGGGNPFLMFLCLAVLLQHRDFIMRNQMDYNELAMHFDKMVRKHNVTRVLGQARRMYAQYLQLQGGGA